MKRTLLLFAFVTHTLFAQQQATSLSVSLGTETAVAPLMGFNSATRTSPEWSNVSGSSQFTDSVATLQPQLMRYNLSRTWDWKAGKIMSPDKIFYALEQKGIYLKYPNIPYYSSVSGVVDTEVKFANVVTVITNSSTDITGLTGFWRKYRRESNQLASSSIVRPQEFKKMLDAASAEPVVVFNMLTSNVDYQLEMIEEFENLGNPVSHIELGSEYNHAGATLAEHLFWPKDTNGNITYTYGDSCWAWMEAIWELYPTMKIGLTTGNRSNVPYWNNQLTDLLNKQEWNDPNSTFYGKKNQLSFLVHYYNFTSQMEVESNPVGLNNIIDDNGVEFFYGFPQWQFQCLINNWWEVGDFLDAGYSVWITEYNLSEPKNYIEVAGTWLHGLFLAQVNKTFLDMSLSKQGDISMILNHNIGTPTATKYNAIDASSTGDNRPTATGEMLKLWNKTFYEMDEIQRLSFLDNGSIPNWSVTYTGYGMCNQAPDITIPKVFGYKASNSTGEERYIIVNLSDDEFNINNFNNLTATNTLLLEQYNTLPEKNVLIDGLNKIKTAINLNTTSLILPAYSVSVLSEACSSKITALYAPEPQENKAELRWKRLPGADHYDVQWREKGNPSWIGPLDTYPNSSSLHGFRVINNLTPNTTYEWQVRAQCSPGWGNPSAFSDIQEFTTLSLCEPPSNLKKIWTKPTKARIEWDASTSPSNLVNGYEYRIRLSNYSSWMPFYDAGTTIDTYKKLTNLTPVTKYIWQVRTDCSTPYYDYHSPFVGVTAASPEAFTTLCDAGADDLTVMDSDNTDNIMNFSWTNNSSPTSGVSFNSRKIAYRDESINGDNWNSFSKFYTGGEAINSIDQAFSQGTNPATYEWAMRISCNGSNAASWTSWIEAPSSATFTIPGTGNIRVGAEEVSSIVQVSPNPSRGAFNIQLEVDELQEVSLTITNIQGKEVLNETIELVNAYTKKVDLSNHPKGTYLLRIKTTEGIFTEKLVVH